jgi:hypothetical protein
MKLIRAEVYIIDHDGLGAEVNAQILRNHPDVNACRVVAEEVEIGEWEDNHALNFRDTPTEEFRKCFQKPANPDEWYLQDTRSYVGNDVVFWAKDGRGYTTDVSKAHVYTRDAAFRQAAARDTDLPWPKAYIDGKTRPAVDMQYITLADVIYHHPN